VSAPLLGCARRSLARLAISLLLTRDGTITLDDDETIVALVRNVLMPMLEPQDG
jgi:hypothetical protein